MGGPVLFSTIEELIAKAEERKVPLSEVMIQQEILVTGKSRDDVINQMANMLDVMFRAMERGTTENITSHSGLTGGDGIKMNQYTVNGTLDRLSGRPILQAVTKALATSEVNAAMGIICATPTAGASGVVPGCLFATTENLQLSREQQLNYLFTAGAIGYVIANNASVSGAVGGCQAEIGSAAAMAAGALVEVAGGTPCQSGHAVSFALQSMLGLVCDPVAGLVEIPCIHRNATGASVAMVSADMALAGCEFLIPADEVINAMYNVGKAIPYTLRETALGGLAKTPTGKQLAERLKG